MGVFVESSYLANPSTIRPFSSFRKAGFKSVVIRLRLRRESNVRYSIFYRHDCISISTFEESIRRITFPSNILSPAYCNCNFCYQISKDSDRSLTTVPGKAFFDYGHLSKLILEMPIQSWNSKL